MLKARSTRLVALKLSSCTKNCTLYTEANPFLYTIIPLQKFLLKFKSDALLEALLSIEAIENVFSGYPVYFQLLSKDTPILLLQFGMLLKSSATWEWCPSGIEADNSFVYRRLVDKA